MEIEMVKPVFNPAALFQHNISVPRSLAGITRTADNEVDPGLLGLMEQDRDAIWRAIKDLYRTGAYPAIAICIRRHGEILLNRTIGHAKGNGLTDTNVEKVIASPDTPFCLFSASKAITAMLIHLLEERKQINLFNPVSYYIPEFAQNGKKRITVQQVLSHRAGLAGMKSVKTDDMMDHDRMMEWIYNARPSERYGREQAYHALTGGYILGELVKRVTGDDIREFMRVNVQEPMGMVHFNYGAPNGRYAEVATNYVTGMSLTYPTKVFLKRILGTDLITAVRSSNEPEFYKRIIPAANIVATAEESCRFFQCLLNGGEYEGKRIFHPCTVEQAVQEASSTSLDKMLLVPMRYSSGMMLGNNPIGLFGPQTSKAFGHIGLTNNFCWADPERMIAVSLLTSGNPVLGTHLPRLAKLLYVISKRCRKVFKH